MNLDNNLIFEEYGSIGRAPTPSPLTPVPVNSAPREDTNPYIKRLLKFAQQHDWGRDARIIDGEVVIYDPGEEQSYKFKTVDELREWAGY
jgi:hypothetical protein